MPKEKLKRIEKYLDMQAHEYEKASMFQAQTVEDEQYFEAIAENYLDAVDLVDSILEKHFKGEK